MLGASQRRAERGSSRSLPLPEFRYAGQTRGAAPKIPWLGGWSVGRRCTRAPLAVVEPVTF